jgi:DNA-binding FrmR family transcriptional regulator
MANNESMMDDETTRDILNRLKSIEGHVRGVQRMVENGDYCVDVVNQILAVQRALQKVNGMVLDRHVRTCVTTAIRGDDADDRERVIGEIMGVFDATGKL